jgi:hypothetical protein
MTFLSKQGRSCLKIFACRKLEPLSELAFVGGLARSIRSAKLGARMKPTVRPLTKDDYFDLPETSPRGTN